MFPFSLKPALISTERERSLSGSVAAHIFAEGNRVSVRRQGFWDNMRFELAEALAHQGCHFMLPLLDEASGAV